MQWKRVERRSAASAVRSTLGQVRPADLPRAAFRSAAQPATHVQPLEQRRLMSVSLAFETLVNASKNPFNQSETAIAINPTNMNNVFMSSNHGAFVVADQGPQDPISETGIFTSYTTDGGATWNTNVRARDDDQDAISDDNSTDPAARTIGKVSLTDSDGGSTTNPDIGALATNAAGVTYSLNFGPGNRIQISTLAIPTTPVGAQAPVAGTTVAEVYSQALSAGGSVLNGAITGVSTLSPKRARSVDRRSPIESARPSDTEVSPAQYSPVNRTSSAPLRRAPRLPLTSAMKMAWISR